ncbi:MAG: L,D-transpeptidase [Verrucomicrobiales bacterium]
MTFTYQKKGRITASILPLVAGALVVSASPALAREKKLTPAPDKAEIDAITRVQIFLDENHFGPGKIDGRLGEFTKKALAHYNFSTGVNPKDWGPVLKKSKVAVAKPYTEYTMKDDDFGYIGELSFEISEQAERKYLVYRSIQEFIAERFHTDEQFLTNINPKMDWYTLRPGDKIKVPNVTEFKIEDVVRNKAWGEEEVLSKRHVIVDTSEKIAAIWEGDKLIATFPVTPGQEQFIYRGDFEIKVMVNTPTFRYDKSMLKNGVRSDEFHQLPPGPNSPVGLFWAGINKSGIGLHGTASPHTIGRSQSAGCIRFANWDAVRLSSLIRPGARVEVR